MRAYGSRSVHEFSEDVYTKGWRMHLELHRSTLDVHSYLQAAFLDQRRIDFDPVSLERRHSVCAMVLSRING